MTSKINNKIHKNIKKQLFHTFYQNLWLITISLIILITDIKFSFCTKESNQQEKISLAEKIMEIQNDLSAIKLVLKQNKQLLQQYGPVSELNASDYFEYSQLLNSNLLHQTVIDTNQQKLQDMQFYLDFLIKQEPEEITNNLLSNQNISILVAGLIIVIIIGAGWWYYKKHYVNKENKESNKGDEDSTDDEDEDSSDDED